MLNAFLRGDCHLLPLALMGCCLLGLPAVNAQVHDPATTRDPTAPQAYQPKNVENDANLPTLSAILISGKRRIAILNNHPIQEGESVHGYQVKSIRRNRVLIMTPEGLPAELRLGPIKPEPALNQPASAPLDTVATRPPTQKTQSDMQQITPTQSQQGVHHAPNDHGHTK